MEIYTYCSYKGNYNGFQYAFFEVTNKNSIEKINKIQSVKNTDDFPEGFKQIKEILERKSGWKLILKKSKGGKGILCISKVEEESEIKKKKILEELEYRKSVNKIRGLQEDTNDISWENVETDFFINLAFVGKMEYVQAIAAHYISDMICNLNGEEHDSWLNRMENILEKSSDRKTYLLNSEQYCVWIKEIINKAQEEKTEEVYHQSNDNGLTKLKARFMKKFYPDPYVRLDNKDKTKGRKSRIRDVEEQVIKPLMRKIEFSQEYGVIITNGGTLPETEEGNIVFDMEYLQ